MNENIDLTKILNDCPEGTTFWSDNYGEVQFKCIIKTYNYPINYPILVKRTDGHNAYYTKEGWYDMYFPASCLLWPSKDCRDWNRFTVPWYKKEKFDPNTLKTFDKVLVRNERDNMWRCSIFSHINDCFACKYIASNASFKYCIPYNDDTKHLIGTTEEAPAFYRYWKD